ncbi:unnamed protein product [Gongylonema pulchrum]|uniref:NOC3-like protein n=1 Tax=Gongylonema pulchrum TaxID=637853 RepID=A0A183E1X4_9BILA|nr:unnamed protein product [Gongylonema pulchrum]
MVDTADIDWQNSAFASRVQRMQKARDDAALEDIECKGRRFAGSLDDNMRELLPIKVGSKVVRQVRMEEDLVPSDEEDTHTEVKEAGEAASSVDLSHLSAAEFLKLRNEHLEKAKNRISSLAYTILADPQDEVRKLKDFYALCTGDGVMPAVRETVMKLASVSVAQVFIDIIPGYTIRARSEEEMTQKLKKETRKLFDYEQALLRYYLKYLKHLEKYAGKLLLKTSREWGDKEMPFVCLKCLGKLLVSVPHFNYISEIIRLIVRIATSGYKQATGICCDSLNELFRNDLSFQATETMNHVFATYFRVIKRLSTSSLLEPVLEGLAKFAHLISIEFFDDMVSALAALHLQLIDSLRCIFTVFVILSGEGVALNIDPFRFYWSMYRLLPAIVFEKLPDKRARSLSLALHTLDLMINSRRKQVPVARVAAFVKRLLALAFFLPATETLAVLLCVRSFFIAYPKLHCMVEDTDGTSFSGSFNSTTDDPDCCGALSSSVIVETDMLSKVILTFWILYYFLSI